MRTKFALACIASTFAMASCQKEISADVLGTTTPNPLIGTWKFVRLHGYTNASQEVSDEGSDVKTITIADFVTVNNQGTYTFTDTSFAANAVGYDISATAKNYAYENGNLEDSTDYPFIYTVAPASGQTSYKRVGSDSLSFSSALIPVAGSSGALATGPTGCKYVLSGDTLTITAGIHQAFTDNSMGVPITVTDDGSSQIVLARP